MDLLSDIEWYINSKPKTCVRKSTGLSLTKEELNLNVIEKNKNKNIRISFPVNDNFTYYVTREYNENITVEKLLSIIYYFYKEPMDLSKLDDIFYEMDEWKDEVINYYDGNLKKLTNYDAFTDTCTPDFCGLEYDKETHSYYVMIGPE